MAKGEKRSNRAQAQGPETKYRAWGERQLKSGQSAHPDLEPGEAELGRFGIERIPADVFLWRGYRYTHLRDALAAAKRAEKE